jgi:hypothetical protein
MNGYFMDNFSGYILEDFFQMISWTMDISLINEGYFMDISLMISWTING